MTHSNSPPRHGRGDLITAMTTAMDTLAREDVAALSIDVALTRLFLEVGIDLDGVTVTRHVEDHAHRLANGLATHGGLELTVEQRQGLGTGTHLGMTVGVAIGLLTALNLRKATP